MMQKIVIAAIVFGLVTASAVEVSEAPVEQMKQQTIRVEVPIKVRILQGKDAGKEGILWSGGSSFVVGEGRHVVTNHHVCCDLPGSLKGKVTELGRAVFVRISDEKEGLIEAKVVWSDKDKDLAILELEKDLGRPPVGLAPEQAVKDRQVVISMGFPGAAEATTDKKSELTVKITDGVVSAKVNDKQTGTAHYQHTASINPGNSGGPLFDECGRLVGINVAHIQGASDTYYAIRVNELIPALEKLGIPTDVSGSGCVVRPPASTSAMVMQYGSLVLAIGAVGFAITRRGRKYVSQKYTNYKTRYSRDAGGHPQRTPPPVPVAVRRPVLRGIAGYYAGTSVELGDNPWTLGRDSRVSNLVFPGEVGGISKRHCVVRFDSALGQVLLEDAWSTNGTFLQDGRKVAPGQPLSLVPGQRFYLGDTGTMFEVAMESG